MIALRYFVSICALGWGMFVLLGTLHAQDQQDVYGESRPLSSYRFSGVEGPASDPVYDRVEPEEAIPADPNRFEFQAIGDCNSCSGASFTPSFASLHEKMRGTWGYPECNEAEDVLTQTQFFSLWHGDGGLLCMESVMLSEQWGDFYVLETQTGETYVEVTNDGLMRTGLPNEEPISVRKQAVLSQNLDIDAASFNMGREYASCAFYPKEKLQKVSWFIKLMSELDGLVASCIGDGRDDLRLSDVEYKECTSSIFDHFDRDASGSLDFEELGRVFYRAQITFDTMGECVSLSPRYQKRTQDKLASVVNDTIMALDKDEDLALSYNELSVIEARKVELFEGEMLFSYIGLLDYFPFLKP